MPPLDRAGTDAEAELPEYAGQYRLESRLGAGGMGVVHLARTSSGRPLAIKVVHADLAADREFRARFRQEVGAARRVSGAFTAPVVDADPDAVRPWMATSYIPAPTLAEHVRRNGPLQPDALPRLTAGLAEALRDIHRAGVVHRDLKPGNVLLAADGPKVIDFGISRPLDSDVRTETGRLIGTPPFMAPEQFQRPRAVGPAADVFALGSVLVHAATGRGPFDSDSPYMVAYQVVHDEADLAGVPAGLLSLIRSCLAKEPSARPSPDALMAALRTVPEQRPPAPRDAVRRSPNGRDQPGTGPPDEQPRQSPTRRRAAPGEPADGAPGDHAPTDGEHPPRTADGTAADNTPADGGTPAAGWTSPRRSVKAVPDGSSDAGPAGPGRRGRPPRRLVAVLAVAVLGVGALWTVRQLGPSDSPALQRRPGPSSDRWQPWHLRLDSGPTAGAAADRGGATGAPLVFCSAGGRDLYCSAAGVKAARVSRAGEVTWRVPAGAQGGAPTAPRLSGGLVVSLSGDGSRLEAFDPDSHRRRWTRAVTSARGRVYLAGDTVLSVADDGTVTAVNSATNRRRWRHPIDGQVGPPVLHAFGDGRTAYAVSHTADGGRTSVAAIDPVSGRQRWRHWLTGDLTPVGTSGHGVLLLTSVNRESQTDAVVRYDPGGRRESRIPLTVPLNSALATGRRDTVYLLGDEGGLVAVDTTRTGGAERAQRWRLETSVSNASPLVAVGDDRLYFSAADGRLLAVDTAAGALLGQTPPRPGRGGQGFVGTMPAPVVAGGKVFAAAPDGRLFAVDARRPSHW